MAGLKPDRFAVQTACIVAALLVDLGQSQTEPLPMCSSFSSCDACVPHARCLWCFSTNNCSHYPVSWLLPPPSLCPLSQARWGVCWFNFEALIITLGVVAGIVVLALIICCCYCCCLCKKCRARRRNRRIPWDDDTRGLKSHGDHPYNKFENE